MFLIAIIAAASILFGQIDSGTILSEQRQEKEQRVMQNFKPAPPEEIIKDSDEDADPGIAVEESKPDKQPSDPSCNESKTHD